MIYFYFLILFHAWNRLKWTRWYDYKVFYLSSPIVKSETFERYRYAKIRGRPIFSNFKYSGANWLDLMQESQVFDILIIWEYVKNYFQNFQQIFTFWDPLSKKKTVFTKVFVNQQHPTRIMRIRAIFAFLKFFFGIIKTCNIGFW